MARPRRPRRQLVQPMLGDSPRDRLRARLLEIGQDPALPPLLAAMWNERGVFGLPDPEIADLAWQCLEEGRPDSLEMPAL